MLLHIKNICKKYNGKPVLSGIDLKLKAGELHVILGPSGEGKSTLLSIIAGFVRQDKGHIAIEEIEMSGQAACRRPVGFVFQENALFPHLTVYENICYGIKTFKNRKDIADLVAHYAYLTGTEDLLPKYPHQLSGGQKQRVSLSRSLILKPKILLLDEPLSSVDNLLKDKLIKEIKEIQRKCNMAMLYVTHNQDEAMRLADNVSVLHQGRIEQTGTPTDIFLRPRTTFVAGFVGIKNIFQATLHRLEEEAAWFDVHCPLNRRFRIKTKRYPVFNRFHQMAFCIQPEHIFLREKTADRTNCFCCEIKSIEVIHTTANITVDMFGLEFVLTVPKKKISELSDRVCIQLPESAFLPLCQNRYKRMAFDRDFQCLQYSGRDLSVENTCEKVASVLE